MASNLRVLLILTAIVISALSGMANEQSPAKQNERYSWPPGNSTLSSTEVENLHESAEKGNVKAQVKLGRYYFSSNGIESFRWFKKAAEKAGDYPFDTAEAQIGLGWCYKEGKGVKKNEAEAEKWLRNGAELETKTRKAAELGNAKAQVQLAFYYALRDNGIESFKWFKQAAENTDSDSLSVAQAQHWLGLCFLGGQVVKKNEAEAEKWLKKAFKLSYNTYRERAEKGDAEAAHDLGVLLLLQTSFLTPYKSLPEDEAKAEAVKWFKKSAELGFAEAQNTLGWIYNNGDGVPQDESEAFKWFRKAAEQGHAKSQLKLGHCYAFGDGVAEDEAEAVKWYRKAAEQGLAGAQNILGKIYLSGKMGVNKDPSEAVKWYRMGADQGDEGSQTNLGRCYAQGIGVPKNNEESLKWFYKVAKRNRISAFQLGRDYYNGWNDVEKNLTEAVKFFQISAERGHDGNPFYDDAQFQLGVCYENGEGVPKDEAEAVKCYRNAAEQGHAPSQRKLGEFYEYGKGVQKDKSEAEKWYRKAAKQGVRAGEFRVDGVDVEKNQVENLKWYRKAAEMGFADAQYYLGLCYENGEGITKDEAEAVAWYTKAAEQGHEQAQKNLVLCYVNWKGVQKDEAEAVKWYRMGADQGLAVAQHALGVCYAQGEGVQKDYVEAAKWYRKAAEQGHDLSQVTLGECYAQGIGVPKDNVEALKWFQKADLGKRYFYGWGVEKNTGEAVKFFQKAAEVGDAEAPFYLGFCYYHGQGVEKNAADAVKWYRKAAEQGHAEAQFNLGACYYNGQGVDKNAAEALKWFRKAAEQGHQKAKDALSTHLKTPSQAKLALLIANSSYTQFGGLARTAPDAKILAKVLNSMGFQVYLLQNASREQMLDALKSFENKVRGTNALAFFHYGGHGVQVDGKNYLIPADAEIPDERRVSTRAVDLDEVIASLESAKPKASVLVVDACRHNPLPANATRSATRGLAVVGRKPKNSVIIFAAEAGYEALDGLFTPVFAKTLAENQEKSLNQIMQKVRSEVFSRSNGAQTPGEYNQLFEDVYLSPNK